MSEYREEGRRRARNNETAETEERAFREKREAGDLSYRERSAHAGRRERDGSETGRPYRSRQTLREDNTERYRQESCLGREGDRYRRRIARESEEDGYRRRARTYNDDHAEAEYDDAYGDGETEYDTEEYEPDDDADEYEAEEEAPGVKRSRNYGSDGGSVKRRSAAPLVVFLLVVLVTVIGGGVFYLVMQKPERKLPGVWRAEIDLTDRVLAEAESWLSSAEGGDQVSVRERLGEIRVGVILTVSADGSWSQIVDADSYAAAAESAYSALSDGLRELLLLRIAAAGREAGSTEEAERLIADTIGMSTEEYLRLYGPELLPSEEELRTMYDGSGSYQAKGNQLGRSGLPEGNGSGESSDPVLRETDETVYTEQYLISDDYLVITGNGATQVYHRD